MRKKTSRSDKSYALSKFMYTLITTVIMASRDYKKGNRQTYMKEMADSVSEITKNVFNAEDQNIIRSDMLQA